MPRNFSERFTKAWFSNYEEPFAFGVECPACGSRVPFELSWSEAKAGFGGNAEIERNATTPFLLRLHVVGSCTCGEQITVYFTGAAGGRQGEVQYGVAGLRYGSKTLV